MRILLTLLAALIVTMTPAFSAVQANKPHVHHKRASHKAKSHARSPIPTHRAKAVKRAHKPASKQRTMRAAKTRARKVNPNRTI